MKKYKNGVYYNPENDQIFIIHSSSDVIKDFDFIFVDYESEFQRISLTIYLKRTFDKFVYLGEL